MSRRQSRGAIQDHMDSLGIGQGEIMLISGIALGLYVLYKGGIEDAANAAGKALANAAANAATGLVKGTNQGAIDTVRGAIGVPTSDQSTKDPGVVRWIIDHPAGGYSAAAMRTDVITLARALKMDAGTGTAPTSEPLASMYPDYIDIGGSSNVPF